MGKLGRFACIFTPMALTIASLICLALVMSGQLSKNSSIQRDLYFFKADTSKFNDNPEAIDLPGNDNIDNNLLAALQGAASTDDGLKDFYKVGLWNYCEGDKDDNGKETITYCSPRKNYFWFNPVDVWELSNTTAQKIFPDEMQKGLNTYQKVAKWMFASYIIAICLTAAEFLIGFSAIFSRWGSLVTTIVSTAQTVFVFAAATTSTALYATLVGVFESVLKPYNIKASMGTKMLSVLWLGVAFSLASGFFWLISVCCCSGKSGHKKVVVEKTPYTYERVASPYMGVSGNAHEMHPPTGHGTTGSAYEPFRHQQHNV
ncbi:hypothetical protein BU26DRAFT_527826 [Trematosphaeria pertusa]|uniref:Integral membrane protein-like protein n=1 Tax=Trematosphaeria pertusa TaxID=390896 RepID=A0A6A6IWS2_9PLEO|nr:uncharacterized protein BU26DRAFT_527826 [Trematosphaeria pertusa]KAF2254909.1 hypothetical protein BU26DRAFT_527826 [Trematosphaeria pertusa]